MFGLLGCLVYHRKELVKEYLMLSELTVPNVSLRHSFKGTKVARFKLKRYQGCEGARVEKVAKSDFQTLKISRLQGCKVAKAAKSDILASTLLNFGRVGGGGGGGR